MRDPEQKMRFNKQELGLIKNTFAENEDVLYAIRKVLLQFSLTEQEEIAVRKVMSPTVSALIQKFFLPTLEGDAPLFQLTDIYLGLGAEIKELSVDSAWQFIKAKELVIDYLEQQLAILNDADVPIKILFNDLIARLPKTQKEQYWVNIMARNYLLSFVDSTIQQIKFLAGQKDETVEQTLDRLKKDSSK